MGDMIETIYRNALFLLGVGAISGGFVLAMRLLA